MKEHICYPLKFHHRRVASVFSHHFLLDMCVCVCSVCGVCCFFFLSQPVSKLTCTLVEKVPAESMGPATIYELEPPPKDARATLKSILVVLSLFGIWNDYIAVAVKYVLDRLRFLPSFFIFCCSSISISSRSCILLLLLLLLRWKWWMFMA